MRRSTVVCFATLLFAVVLAFALAAFYALRPVTLIEALQKNFDQATRGESILARRMIEMPSDTTAGIICYPAHLDGNAPWFDVILPQDFAGRKGVLAVITPNGSFREIYSSYGEDVESIDLIIPSRAIEWQNVRKKNIFSVDARTFDALAPNEDMPQPLFREAGIYQIALLNGQDRGLLEVNKAPFRVKAGCVVHWQP